MPLATWFCIIDPVADSWLSQIDPLPPLSDYPRCPKLLNEADIGQVALEIGLYTDSQSAIRCMELCTTGFSSVLSYTQTHTEQLEDGVHTRFVRWIEQWVDSLE